MKLALFVFNCLLACAVFWVSPSVEVGLAVLAGYGIAAFSE